LICITAAIILNVGPTECFIIQAAASSCTSHYQCRLSAFFFLNKIKRSEILKSFIYYGNLMNTPMFCYLQQWSRKVMPLH